MKATTYEGARGHAGAQVRALFTYEGERRSRVLSPRFDIRKHSPDGFEWGYSGSGPAQLALAISCDALGDDERAQRVYQRVKDRFIAPIQADDFTISAQDVRDYVDEIDPPEQSATVARGEA